MCRHDFALPSWGIPLCTGNACREWRRSEGIRIFRPASTSPRFAHELLEEVWSFPFVDHNSPCGRREHPRSVTEAPPASRHRYRKFRIPWFGMGGGTVPAQPKKKPLAGQFLGPENTGNVVSWRSSRRSKPLVGRHIYVRLLLCAPPTVAG